MKTTCSYCVTMRQPTFWDMSKRASDDKPVRLVGTHVDITEHKKAEQELQLAKYIVDHAPLNISLVLQQVLMNLLKNAADAVDGIPSPRIRCSLSPYVSSKAFRQKHPQLTAGHFACIAVEDNGHGIPGRRLEKIFEPFFTTKEVGKGTGLGLAMLYGAIQTHGGVVEVESEINSGALFRVYLPLSGSELDTDAEKHVPGTLEHDATILLVDDDETVRSTTGEVLTSMGYHVVEAGNGEEALDMFKARRNKIDLIISDVIMPRMGGAALLKLVRRLDEKMPIILVTGYDKDHVLDKDIESQEYLVLNKPFDFGNLSRSIQTLMKLT